MVCVPDKYLLLSEFPCFSLESIDEFFSPLQAVGLPIARGESQEIQKLNLNKQAKVWMLIKTVAKLGQKWT